MAYTLMAEAKAPLDWAALHGAIAPIRKRVEVFPVPAANGLGLSVPQRHRNELALEELAQLFEVFQGRFGMTVVDLHTGTVVDPASLDRLKNDFVVEC
jgi:hypothetical protein